MNAAALPFTQSTVWRICLAHLPPRDKQLLQLFKSHLHNVDNSPRRPEQQPPVHHKKISLPLSRQRKSSPPLTSVVSSPNVVSTLCDVFNPPPDTPTMRRKEVPNTFGKGTITYGIGPKGTAVLILSRDIVNHDGDGS